MRLLHRVPLLALVTVACTGEQPIQVPVISGVPILRLATESGAPTTSDLLVYLEMKGEKLVVGSFRLHVRYDTAQLVFATLEHADSLNAFAHASNGQVVVAAASTAGYRAGEWLSLRFTSHKSPADPSSLGLAAREITDLDGRDIMREFRVESQVTSR